MHHSLIHSVDLALLAPTLNQFPMNGCNLSAHYSIFISLIFPHVSSMLFIICHLFGISASKKSWFHFVSFFACLNVCIVRNLPRLVSHRHDLCVCSPSTREKSRTVYIRFEETRGSIIAAVMVALGGSSSSQRKR